MIISAGRKNAHNRTKQKLIMMTMNTSLTALAFGITVAAVASPAVAQRNNSASPAGGHVIEREVRSKE
jgi:Na+/H+-dicarboxylate symporter